MKKWLDKGDGGQWYEPYVTNRDLIYIGILTTMVSCVIIIGCVIINVK